MTGDGALSQGAIERILALDPTLREDERKALAWLLLVGSWVKVADLAVGASIARGTIYDVIRRLEARDLVVTDTGPGEAKQVRTADPRLLLPILTAHAETARRTADELSRAFGDIREKLVGIYEALGEGGPIGPADPVHFTRSMNGAVSRLLRSVKGATKEVWVLGTEAPWIQPSSVLFSELISRAMPPGPLKVRFLVVPHEGDPSRSLTIAGLRNTSVEFRSASGVLGAYVVVDRTTLFLYQRLTEQPPTGYYVDVEAPALCDDLIRSATREWERAEERRKKVKG